MFRGNYDAVPVGCLLCSAWCKQLQINLKSDSICVGFMVYIARSPSATNPNQLVSICLAIYILSYIGILSEVLPEMILS